MGVKGNTKRAFGDSSDSESESEEDKFGQYVKRKAAEANKRVQNAKKFEFDVESETEKPSKEQPAKSRFIGNILESRKQRELDKLQAQSLKIKLERKLEGEELKGRETFVTESYREKQALIHEAETRAQNEEMKEKQDGAIGVYHFTRKLLLDDDDNDDDDTTSESKTATRTLQERKNITFENDVYRAKPSKITRSFVNSSNKQDVGPGSTNTKNQIQIFLASQKSQEELEKLTQEYWKRSNTKKIKS